ncbi:MAG: ComF family protein [Actinomycetota bacterium]
MWDRLLDVLYPRTCAGCRRGPWPFCPDCMTALVAVTPPLCDRCGRPLVRTADTCRDCPPSLHRARAAFVYEGPVRSAVLRLKFAGDRSVARALGSAMASAWAPADASGSSTGADVVTWVPLSPKRRAKRGYDQARALAVVVAREHRLPTRPLLRRVRDVGPQARRAGADRRQVMEGVFRSIRTDVPERVLLVDDVLTTGATAAACADALRSAGACEVSLLVAARSVRGRAGAMLASGSGPGLWLPGRSSPGSRSQSQAKRPT